MLSRIGECKRKRKASIKHSFSKIQAPQNKDCYQIAPVFYKQCTPFLIQIANVAILQEHSESRENWFLFYLKKLVSSEKKWKFRLYGYYGVPFILHPLKYFLLNLLDLPEVHPEIRLIFLDILHVRAIVLVFALQETDFLA